VCIRPLVLTAALVLLGSPVRSTAQESLGDLARQVREQRAKSEKKPVKVFTNDDLPQRPPVEGRTAASAMSTTPKTEQPAAEKQETKETSKEDKIKTKDFWQARFKAAREVLAHQKEIQQLAEDELNLLQIQQARELDPTAKQDLDGKVQAKQAEVEQARAVTAKAQKALDDLGEDFKESGAPEEWSKTD
jgi:hypothetical protein